MNVYHELDGVCLPPSAVALGMFDGVHLGHREVIRSALSCEGLLGIVLTFTTTFHRPHKKAAQKDILTPEGRLAQLENLGVEAVYMPAFERLQSLSPEEFVRCVLHEGLNARVVCCGEDFHFGYHATGNVRELKHLCEPYGIDVRIVAPKLDGGQPVSSTRIRTCLLEGDIPAANRMLGYRYFIEGAVVYGKQIGRTINCPTINQQLSEQICLPKFGVYVSTTCVDGVNYPSITNIGKKPTIAGDRQPLAETHVIGVNKQMYGEVLRVTLYQFIRGEEKFDSIAELSQYIHRDIQTAKVYFNH